METASATQDNLTREIIGAAIEVHRELGPGLLESIYEEALSVELELRGLAFSRQVGVDVVYKERVIKGQRIDVIVENEVVVEIKVAVKSSRDRTRADPFISENNRTEARIDH